MQYQIATTGDYHATHPLP
ncbi:hypothetical protein ACS0PU_010376 [Formica fusca]